MKSFASTFAGAPLGVVLPACVVMACSVMACTQPRTMTTGDAGVDPFIDGAFTCLSAESMGCQSNTYHFCEPDGEFLIPARQDCSLTGDVCVEGIGCTLCRPLSRGCDENGDAVVCNEEGTAWILDDDCDLPGGEACDLGQCRNLCDLALERRSYLGCEFYAADLDNAAIRAGRDASAQQYAIVVSNPGNYPTEVIIELDTGPFGGESTPVVVERVMVLPGDLEVFRLQRREVDGSSSLSFCDADADCMSATEACWCRGGVRPGGAAEDCRCRSSSLGSGLDDGTNSALTSHAYRVRSVFPIVAYQFNPLDNVGVFSNDASLLLPTSALAARYTVVGWPQTIADSENPAHDFPGEDPDLRAFLTIIGTQQDTHVQIVLGPEVENVVGFEPGVFYGSGETLEFDLGMFDVINLETQAFNADFTGTLVSSSGGDRPVAVFVGSEASDAPRFDDIANRSCCADHLEEQLFPDDTLGRRFFIGRQPTRSSALDAAFIDGSTIGHFDEPEYVRLVAVAPGVTSVTRTLPPETFDDAFELLQGESRILVATQDIEINASAPLAVLEVLASQEAVGISDARLPGGDPAIIAIPPVDQYRQDYVFLTPDLYAFDFVTIVAPRAAEILLDERPLFEFDCEVAAADGLERRMDDPPAEWLVYRCQLSYPDVIGVPNVRVEEGLQNDGYHTLRATEEVSLVISGFDRFVSYGYAGGADLDPIF